MSKIELLQAIQNSEINFQINTFWDSGFSISLGDDMNGYKAESEFEDLGVGIDWLIREVLSHYPDSVFADNYIKTSQQPHGV